MSLRPLPGRRVRLEAPFDVIETHDWSVDKLDEWASGFVVTSGLLLTGGPGGRGLAPYSPEGRDTLHLFGDRSVELVATAGSLAYVRTPPGPALHLVDVTRGRVVGTGVPGGALMNPTQT